MKDNMDAEKMQRTLSLEGMRADIARMVGEPPEAIADDSNLMDLGLDSLRAMTLVQKWQEAGARADFAEFAVKPELGYWWQLVSR